MNHCYFIQVIAWSITSSPFSLCQSSDIQKILYTVTPPPLVIFNLDTPLHLSPLGKSPKSLIHNGPPQSQQSPRRGKEARG